MAFTIVRTPSAFGNQRVVMMDVTADAAEQNIVTNMGRVVAYSYGPSSMNSSNIHIAANSTSTGTAAMGTIGVSGCTTGDRFFLTVYGY